ncbi:MAG: triple tyrosine motif-containing protein [Dysgonomonas sp.]
MKKFIVLFLFSLFGLNTYAYHPIVRNFSKINYKSGNQNWGIAQNEFNTMYFANNSGLLEFDGRNWTTYPSANNTNVRSVLCSADGRIYTGAFNEFGYYISKRNGRLEYTSLVSKLDSRFRDFNEVWNIQKDDKSVYFQADKTILKYERDTIVNLPFGQKIDASALLYGVYFVASSKKGAFMLNGGLYVKIQGSDLLLNKKVCAILPFQKNQVLFVTSFNGVYLFNGSSIVPYNTGIDNFLMTNQVFCAKTNNKYIVYGTVQRGIAIQNINDGSVMYVNTYSGLQNNTILSMSFDNQQNLWLGLDKGLDYVLLNSPVMNVFGVNNMYGSGYASCLKDNTLYFGTNQGLYTSPYPLPNTPLPLELKMIDGLQGQVWCLTKVENTIFCGNDRGAFMITQKGVERIQGVEGTWMFKHLQHHPDMILGCSYQGLFILKKENNSWRFSHFVKGKFNEASRLYEEDNEKDVVWFSHWQKGMYRLKFNNEMDSIVKVELFDKTKGFPTNRNNTVYNINDKLIFSSESGFLKYNPQSNKMEQSVEWNHNIFSSPPNSIRLYESKTKDIWFVSGEYIGVISQNENKSPKIDSTSYQILKSKIILGFENFNFIDDKNIIVSTEDGFSWIDLKNDTKIKDNFKVFFRNIFVTNDKDSLVAGRINTTTAETINIFNSNQNSFRFEFIAPEYRSDGIVQYSYFLENYDRTWSEFSTSNIKEYTQLPEGDYTFRVKAKNKFSSEVAECYYSFTISPPWYLSKIAIVIYTILFILLAVLLFFTIKHHSFRIAREVEKRKEEEMKEQELRFREDASEKKKEINDLKNQQLQYELRHKSQELASSIMNVIRKNEILLDIKDSLSKVSTDIKNKKDVDVALSRLNKMEHSIKENIESDNNWKRFEKNFDLVYENYLKKLSELYPDLTLNDKKVCAYLKMGLSSKDIAPLLNMSVRSVEMNRYRLRKKMNLERDINLVEFLQRL